MRPPRDTDKGLEEAELGIRTHTQNDTLINGSGKSLWSSGRGNDPILGTLKERQAGRSSKSLLKNYSRIAHNRQKGLLKNLMGLQGPNGAEVVFNESSTWSACFEQFTNELVCSQKSNVQLCVLVAETRPARAAFNFWHKSATAGERRFEEANRTPQWVLLHLLARSWGLENSESDDLLQRLGSPSPSLPTWQAELPSQKDTDVDGSKEHGIRNNRAWMNLSWARTAPHFVADLHVYVWQPFGRMPRLEQLSIQLYDVQGENASKILVTVGSSALLARLREHGLFSTGSSQDVSSGAEFLGVLMVICRAVRDDSVAFIKETSSDVNYLVLEGRLNPSGSKIQHLVHTMDCLEGARNGLEGSTETLEWMRHSSQKIGHVLTSTEGCEIAGFLADFTYLRDEVMKLEKKVKELQKAIKDQIDLVHGRRTSILTIMAGIYIPFSFVSALFGMNIAPLGVQSPSWNNVTEFSNASQPIERNQTIQTDGGNQTWSLSQYWMISLPLTFGTILLPLVIGAAVRWTLKTVTRNRNWWRAIMTFGGSLILLIIAVVAALLTMSSPKHS